MNNEPSDDLSVSDGRGISSDIQEFAKSWALDPNCPSRTVGAATSSPTISEEVQTLCEVFFSGKVSPFSTCFPRVPSGPFLQMCLKSATTEEACTSAVAYMNLCAVENTPMRIPEACVK